MDHFLVLGINVHSPLLHSRTNISATALLVFNSLTNLFRGEFPDYSVQYCKDALIISKKRQVKSVVNDISVFYCTQ